MKSAPSSHQRSGLLSAAGILTFLCLLLLLGVVSRTHAQSPAPTSEKQKGFASAEEAADALINAAEKFDEAELKAILGPDSYDIIHTGEPVRDKEAAAEFVAQARSKKNVSVAKNARRAFLSVGENDWPFPVPIVRQGGRWFFDASAGRQEILYRRIGHDELDAIQVCRGFVDAQHEYALKPREGYDVNQYAQHIVSSPG